MAGRRTYSGSLNRHCERNTEAKGGKTGEYKKQH